MTLEPLTVPVPQITEKGATPSTLVPQITEVPQVTEVPHVTDVGVTFVPQITEAAAAPDPAVNPSPEPVVNVNVPLFFDEL